MKDALQTNPNTESLKAFVTKLAPDGSTLVYSTYLGGTGNDIGLGIAVDLLGSSYVAGVTASPDFPTTPGAYQQTNAGVYDGFIVKIAAATVGKITGGGSIPVADNIGTFGFIVQRARADAPIQGDLQYMNHATGAKVRSVTFNSLSVNDTTAAFGGTCINNGVPCTRRDRQRGARQHGYVQHFHLEWAHTGRHASEREYPDPLSAEAI